METQTTTTRRRVNQKNKPTIKRLLANKCERERVRKINEAFEILKKHIPYCDSGRIRTKLDVLKFAIDYIQILTKMVSQNEAAMLLRTSQMEKIPDFLFGAGASEAESRRSSGEMFPTRLEETSTFLPDDQQSQLETISPTLSDEEVFFGANMEENITSHHHLWSQYQTGFEQLQYHNETTHQTLLQAQRTASFEEQQQDLLSFWSYQGNEIPETLLPLGPTTPPSESNEGDLTAWLNL